jgi:hypothetical protein
VVAVAADRKATAIPAPDEAAVRFAAASFHKGYALFRDPKHGGTALLPTEIEDIARTIVREYLWALDNGSSEAAS